MTEQVRVWAPAASAVELVINGTGNRPMDAEPDGWGSVRVGEHVYEREGTDYGFLVDGAGPFPDPRSRWQPNGVHRLSRTFDAEQYRWERDRWTGRQLAGAVIYELDVGTFTPEGTLDAAASRLGHLVELGVDFVELLPVNAFNGTYNSGYD